MFNSVLRAVWLAKGRHFTKEVFTYKITYCELFGFHDVVIKRKHYPRYWRFVRGIHRSPVNSPHKGQWRGALMLSLICAWINGWVNNCEAGDLRRHRAHYGVTVMYIRTFHNINAVTYTKLYGRDHPTIIKNKATIISLGFNLRVKLFYQMLGSCFNIGNIHFFCCHIFIIKVNAKLYFVELFLPWIVSELCSLFKCMPCHIIHNR